MEMWSIPEINGFDDSLNVEGELRKRPPLTFVGGVCQACGQKVEMNNASLCKHFQTCPGRDDNDMLVGMS